MFSVSGHQFRVASRLAMAGLLALLIGGCSGGALDKLMNPPDSDASDAVSGADLTARNPSPISNRLRDPPGIPGAVYNDGGVTEASAAGGEGRPPAAPGEEVTPTGSGYDINFQNADINAVAKVILGDLLKLTYSVDPRVQGTLSLSSGRPIAREDLLPTFESAVKIVNANIVRESGIYKVVPIGEALGNGEIDTARLTPGYGVSVLPLRHASAQGVLRAIDSFAAKPGQARIEPKRNLLLVQGTSAERQSAIDAALALDVDWLKNQSVGVFPVRNASPDTVIKELENVFDSGREGAGQHLVRFQSINRLNAVLAVGQSPRVIEQVKTWVARLDKADYENTTVRVYKLRYAQARQVAAILRDVFTGQGSGTSLGNQDLSQLTPGASFTRQTSMGTSASPTGGSSTTQTNTQQINTPAFGGGTGTGDPDAGAGRPGEPSGRGGRGATGVDLSTLSTGGGNTGPAPLPNVRITPDSANNSLLIYASRDQYKMVERAIFELDKAPMQVAIDVTVAEVTLRDRLQYGIQYYFSDGNVPGSIGFGMGGISSTGKLILSRMTGANFILGSDNNPRIVLDALRTVTDVKVLSAPALVVLDNQPAVLQVGDQVPVITQQATGVITNPANPALVNSVERHDTGVILKVVPRINANGVVNLDVSQEVSAVASNDPRLGPTIAQRRVQSSVAVASGQTVLLGGLISSNQRKERNNVPILGDIKGPLGDLFATNDKTNERTELIVFIRPQIIRDGIDAQLVAEELRSKLQTMARGTSLEKQLERTRPSNTIFRQQ